MGVYFSLYTGVKTLLHNKDCRMAVCALERHVASNITLEGMVSYQSQFYYM